MKMGKFQGILGMDQLGHNHAKINCNQGPILFTSNQTSSQGNRIKKQGRSSKNPLKVVKAYKIAKGYKKGLPIYILKLNKPEKLEESQDPKWLKQ